MNPCFLSTQAVWQSTLLNIKNKTPVRVGEVDAKESSSKELHVPVRVAATKETVSSYDRLFLKRLEKYRATVHTSERLRKRTYSVTKVTLKDVRRKAIEQASRRQAHKRSRAAVTSLRTEQPSSSTGDLVDASKFDVVERATQNKAVSHALVKKLCEGSGAIPPAGTKETGTLDAQETAWYTFEEAASSAISYKLSRQLLENFLNIIEATRSANTDTHGNRLRKAAFSRWLFSRLLEWNGTAKHLPVCEIKEWIDHVFDLVARGKPYIESGDYSSMCSVAYRLYNFSRSLKFTTHDLFGMLKTHVNELFSDDFAELSHCLHRMGAFGLDEQSQARRLLFSGARRPSTLHQRMSIMQRRLSRVPSTITLESDKTPGLRSSRQNSTLSVIQSIASDETVYLTSAEFATVFLTRPHRHSQVEDGSLSQAEPECISFLRYALDTCFREPRKFAEVGIAAAVNQHVVSFVKKLKARRARRNAELLAPEDILPPSMRRGNSEEPEDFRDLLSHIPESVASTKSTEPAAAQDTSAPTNSILARVQGMKQMWTGRTPEPTSRPTSRSMMHSQLRRGSVLVTSELPQLDIPDQTQEAPSTGNLSIELCHALDTVWERHIGVSDHATIQAFSRVMQEFLTFDKSEADKIELVSQVLFYGLDPVQGKVHYDNTYSLLHMCLFGTPDEQLKLIWYCASSTLTETSA
ncbi:MAG: hypothetical protein MHM6MM_002087 [Cercozoa sp. M6MM]